MESAYYQIQCRTVGETVYWTHTSEPPHHNFWVWGFFPDLGNDDEGYGYVDLVHLDDRYLFCDRNGVCDPQPLLWAAIVHPLLPLHQEKFFKTPDECRKAVLKHITKKGSK